VRWSRQRGPRTRIFFATDIHGSEQCFRKWVNAAEVYKVDVLILGGDITGKALVPIVRNNGRWETELRGELLRASSEDELKALRKRIRTMGFYDILLTDAERDRLRTPKAASDAELEALFQAAIRESLERWIEVADERLRPESIPSYVMLGNDDYPEVAELLRSADAVTYAEDEVVELPGGFEMLSFGYSTPTPWDTPRELPEAELGDRLMELVEGVRAPERAVFNIHCPPFDTHLDQAPRLDEELRPVAGPGGVEQVPVGSKSVRAAIERFQPTLGLHGHVHESPGAEKLGSTLCINPGSDYADGILRGTIVELDAEGVRRWQLVQG
jgi:Icc-related predicted phosphoesterase